MSNSHNKNKKEPSTVHRLPSTVFFIWLVINIFQAFFSELLHDEAYYWLYGTSLDWGYFDHPPLIALWTKIGYAVFQNELGVRLLTAISSSFILYMMWKMANISNNRLFFIVVFSSFLVHVGGFITVPDIPLMLFSVLFLAGYQQYLKQDKLIYALLLAGLTAALLYSKYHGILVLFFSLIAHPAIMRRWTFWLIPSLGFIFFFPHLYWQYVHDFPTFRFHLFDRSSQPYSLMFTVNYLLGTLVVISPFTAIPLLIASAKQGVNNHFERILQFNLWGILAFFLLMSFKGNVEANWIAPAFIPLFVLAVRYLQSHEKLQRITYRLAIPSIVLMLAFRVFMMYDFLPKSLNVRNEMHHWDEWAAEIEETAKDLPVVIVNNYQRAAKYEFYTKKTAHSLSTVTYSGSQYDLWPEREEALQGDSIFWITGGHKKSGFKHLTILGNRKYSYQIVPNFRTYNRIKIKLNTSFSTPAKVNSTQDIEIELTNLGEETIDFKENPKLKPVLMYSFIKGKYKVIQREQFDDKLDNINLKHGESTTLTIPVTMPKEAGEFRFRACIRSAWLLAGRNGNFTKVTVK